MSSCRLCLYVGFMPEAEPARWEQVRRADSAGFVCSGRASCPDNRHRLDLRKRGKRASWPWKARMTYERNIGVSRAAAPARSKCLALRTVESTSLPPAFSPAWLSSRGDVFFVTVTQKHCLRYPCPSLASDGLFDEQNTKRRRAARPTSFLQKCDRFPRCCATVTTRLSPYTTQLRTIVTPPIQRPPSSNLESLYAATSLRKSSRFVIPALHHKRADELLGVP